MRSGCRHLAGAALALGLLAITASSSVAQHAAPERDRRLVGHELTGAARAIAGLP
jgi:hypothetical protein